MLQLGLLLSPDYGLPLASHIGILFQVLLHSVSLSAMGPGSPERLVRCGPGGAALKGQLRGNWVERVGGQPLTAFTAVSMLAHLYIGLAWRGHDCCPGTGEVAW